MDPSCNPQRLNFLTDTRYRAYFTPSLPIYTAHECFVQLLNKYFMYNLKMAIIKRRNM